MTSVDWAEEILQSSQSSPPRKISTFGLAAIAASGGLAVGLMAICGPFIIPAFRKICLPYVPATDSQVSNVLKVLKGRNCKSLVDLGSGDGRIVHALAEHKANFGTETLFDIKRISFISGDKNRHHVYGQIYLNASVWYSKLTILRVRTFTGGNEFVGIELNPWLVLYAKLVAFKRFGSRSNVRFLQKDIWKYNLERHDTVIVFGVECMMDQLRLKSEKELRKGSTVVACRFPFEAWTPTKITGEGVDTVWLYQR